MGNPARPTAATSNPPPESGSAVAGAGVSRTLGALPSRGQGQAGTSLAREWKRLRQGSDAQAIARRRHASACGRLVSDVNRLLLGSSRCPSRNGGPRSFSQKRAILFSRRAATRTDVYPAERFPADDFDCSTTGSSTASETWVRSAAASFCAPCSTARDSTSFFVGPHFSPRNGLMIR